METEHRDSTPFELEGAFAHTLDAKGRVSLPKRFRGSLGERVVVTQGTDDHFLWVFPIPVWKEMRRKLDGLTNSLQAKRVRRFLIGNAHECEIDALGRIQVPAPLREYAGLDKDVIITGMGDTLEIWDKGRKQTADRETGEKADVQHDMEALGI